MADNIDVTPGTGKTVAAEEIGAVIYQQVKLIDSTATSTSPTGVAAKPLQVSLANTGANATAVKVDGSAATQPVSGTVTAISGTAANLKAEVVGTGTFVTQSVVTQGTAANLNATVVGTGTFAVQATTVGTVTPGTAATSLGKAEDAAHTSGDVGVMALTVRNDAGTALAADGDYTPLMVNSAGALYVTGGGGGTQYVEAAAAAADPTGTALNLVSVATPGNEVTAGQNVAARGTIKGELYVKQTDAVPVTDNSGSLTVDNGGTFVVQENGTQVVVDDAAFTPGTTKVVMAGFEADESSTDSVDEGDGGAARMTLDRKQIVVAQPHTNGGCLIACMTSGDGSTALTNTAQAIKASAGQLYGWYIYNPNAAATYVPIYNTAAGSVTVGTTNPVLVLCIPPTSAANILGAVGIEFTNAGFSAAATTTGGGASAPASALEANFFYK